MPRAPREHLPGTLLHTISRFVNREIRVTKPCERQAYLSAIPNILEVSDLLPVCYALMGNHVHWGIGLGRAPLRAFFQPLHARFARWLNRSQRRLGPLFADRPKQFVLDRRRFAYLIAYIHNNPVRAGVVRDPSDCDWTSHRAYIGEAPAPPWLDVATGLALCGFDTSSRGRLAFHEFVCSAASQPREPEWSSEYTARVRTDARAELRAPVEVGAHFDDGPHFAILARPNTPLPARSQVSVGSVLQEVASELELSESELLGGSRRRGVVAGRRLALVVWSRGIGRPQADMAAALGITDSAASQLLSRTPAVRELATRASAVVERCGP